VAITRAEVLAASTEADAVRQAAAPRRIPAELTQAQRIAAARDLQIPDAPDGVGLAGLDIEGGGTTRSARDLLDEAEARVTAADNAATFGAAALASFAATASPTARRVFFTRVFIDLLRSVRTSV
jgi:hypothetical protein